jgi:UbiA prenyltransferase family
MSPTCPVLVASAALCLPWNHKSHEVHGVWLTGCHRLHLVSMQDLSNPGWVAAKALLQALGPALLMNICIVGLNQLYDVEIDRVNKPYLPLASGELSEQQGRWIVAATGAQCDLQFPSCSSRGLLLHAS